MVGEAGALISVSLPLPTEIGSPFPPFPLPLRSKMNNETTKLTVRKASSCFLPLLLLALPLLMGSCFGDEPKNSECDIEEVSIHVDNPTSVFYHDYDTLQAVAIASDSIGFFARPGAEVGAYPLTLTVTEGATTYLLDGGQWVEFRNGTTVDFSGERQQRFKVVSEDGVWNREYVICIQKDKGTVGGDLVLTFTFDGNYALSNPSKTDNDNNVYYVWTETDETLVNELFLNEPWKNGNPGYKLSMSSAKPMEYPTVPARGEGPDGSDCVKMETKDAGPFGRMVNIRLAAGSMFDGYFDVTNALKDARKATLFGLPFKHKPVHFSVWMKCEMASGFQDKDGNDVPNVVDEPDAYVIVYRNQDEWGNQVQLDGDDVLSSKYIIGRARIPHHYTSSGDFLLTNDPIHGVTSEWQQFDMDVEYTEEPDPDILADNGYNMIIGFTSSWRGAYFEGAIGSKLWIDNVVVTCE